MQGQERHDPSTICERVSITLEHSVVIMVRNKNEATQVAKETREESGRKVFCINKC